MTCHRRSIRLPDYDYTQPGAYFVTICTQGKGCLFGDVINGEMRLNGVGTILHTVWDELPQHYPYVSLDAFIAMPNHVHGIIVFSDTAVGAGLKPAPTQRRHGLSEIVRAFKTFSARRINEMCHTPRIPVWQRNYYEHIIRDDHSLNRIREYIVNNPLQWNMDRENPIVGAGFKPAPTTTPWMV